MKTPRALQVSEILYVGHQRYRCFSLGGQNQTLVK